MDKKHQVNFTVSSTTVGELFDQTIDKFFKEKKHLSSTLKKDTDTPLWSSVSGSKKEGGLFGTCSLSSNFNSKAGAVNGETLSANNWSSASSVGNVESGYWSHPGSQRVSVIKFNSTSKNEKKKPYVRI